jgi:hypothetical protein
MWGGESRIVQFGVLFLSAPPTSAVKRRESRKTAPWPPNTAVASGWAIVFALAPTLLECTCRNAPM